MDANEKKELCKEICIHNRLCELLCESKNGCTKCKIREFKSKYDIRIDNCEAIFMAAELLGNSKDTNDFLEQQRENMRRDYCNKNKCTDCHVRMALSENNYTLACLEIYVGMTLLKDV